MHICIIPVHMQETVCLTMSLFLLVKIAARCFFGSTVIIIKFDYKVNRFGIHLFIGLFNSL